MKKVLTFLLALALVFFAVACERGAKDQDATDNPSEQLEQDDTQSKYIPPRVEVNTLSTRNGFMIKAYDIPGLNCTVLLPESWRGKYDLGVTPYGVTIYCKQVWEKEDMMSGILCDFSWGAAHLNDNFELSQPGKILKMEEEYYLFLTYASDVQYSPEDAEHYLEMCADIEEIQVIFED